MTHNDGPELLAQWMARNGMGQTEMSRATGIQRTLFSRYLHGGGMKRFGMRSARLLAGMTGIPVEKLITRVKYSKTERSLETSGQKVA